MIKLSTKQKREIYSISSLILHLLVFAILLLSLSSYTQKKGNVAHTRVIRATGSKEVNNRNLISYGHLFKLM